MSSRKKRTLLVAVALAALSVGLVLALRRPGGAREAAKEAAGAPSPAQEPETPARLEDFGKFKLGSVLGEERGGFSGMPKVFVFTSVADPNWPQIQACLVTAEAAGALEG